MSKPPVILVVLSAEAMRTAALARGVELARRTGGTLHLCSMAFDPLIDSANVRPNAVLSGTARRELLEEQLIGMRHLAGECGAEVFSVHYDVAWASVPHEAILAKALEVNADYVIKDVGRHTLLSRILFTPLDWKLVRMLPCPLMLVRPESLPRPDRILAAIDVLAPDAGRLNACLMLTASTLAEQTAATLDVVSVAPAMPLESHADVGREEQLDPLLSRHREEFLRFTAFYELPPGHRHRLVGAPGNCIASLAAAERFDLVVVGNAYHNALERLLLGSTAEVLLQELGCDLLVVKRDDFVDTLGHHLDLARIKREFAANKPVHFRRELA